VLAGAIAGAPDSSGKSEPTVAPDSTISAATRSPIPPSLVDSCRTEQAEPGHLYRFCDDGLPHHGGLNPNPSGEHAVKVPAGYAGYVGLPPKSKNAARIPGADAHGNIALDVDISYPVGDLNKSLPVIVLQHGCCGSTKTNWEVETTPAGKRFDAAGEGWHFSNAWFASRGYVVITYTERGFRTGRRGSTGQTHLDSRKYEINDFQALACGVTALFNHNSSLPNIAPHRVVASGGSYGGTFAWMTTTDPFWKCRNYTGNAGTKMGLIAAAPRYGWTDLVYSLLPNGTQSTSPRQLPAVNGCDSAPWKLNGSRCAGQHPIGIPKLTIDNVLYKLGIGGFGPGRTTFPPLTTNFWKCLNGIYPPSAFCTRVYRKIMPPLLRESSPYYQNRWFRQIRHNPKMRIPIFDAGTLTDPLFPPLEELRMLNRIDGEVHNYPLQAYFGDYHHFVQNKPAVWADTCGKRGHSHRCTFAEYGSRARPKDLVRTGVTPRLNRFIDHYARPPGVRPVPPRPTFNVTGELEVCPTTANFFGVGKNDGGPQFTAPTFGSLSKGTIHLNLHGGGNTVSLIGSNLHGVDGDPVRSNGGRCQIEKGRAGYGTATFESGTLKHSQTVLGVPRISVRFRAGGAISTMQLDARMYDVFPKGASILMDRGVRRLSKSEAASGRVSYQLNGNGWRFQRGHRIRIELTQDDFPFLQKSSPASHATILGLRVSLPVR
jgi:hypothetical protein